jgi:hypothetical protein
VGKFSFVRLILCDSPSPITRYVGPGDGDNEELTLDIKPCCVACKGNNKSRQFTENEDGNLLLLQDPVNSDVAVGNESA